MKKHSRIYIADIWDGKDIEEAIRAHGYSLKPFDEKEHGYRIVDANGSGQGGPGGTVWYNITGQKIVRVTAREDSRLIGGLDMGFQDTTIYSCQESDKSDLDKSLSESDFRVEQLASGDGDYTIGRDRLVVGTMSRSENPGSFFVFVDNKIPENPLYFFMEEYEPGRNRE